VADFGTASQGDRIAKAASLIAASNVIGLGDAEGLAEAWAGSLWKATNVIARRNGFGLIDATAIALGDAANSIQRGDGDGATLGLALGGQSAVNNVATRYDRDEVRAISVSVGLAANHITRADPGLQGLVEKPGLATEIALDTSGGFWGPVSPFANPVEGFIGMWGAGVPPTPVDGDGTAQGRARGDTTALAIGGEAGVNVLRLWDVQGKTDATAASLIAAGNWISRGANLDDNFALAIAGLAAGNGVQAKDGDADSTLIGVGIGAAANYLEQDDGDGDLL
jgi:hypothetical protein